MLKSISSLKLGDKVYWEDLSLYWLSAIKDTYPKGEVTKIIDDNIVITWENGRITQYSPDMLERMDSDTGMLKIDYQRMRNDKLNELGI